VFMHVLESSKPPSPVSGLFMVIGESALGLVPGEVA
jgi:hypothetical protein